MNFVKFKKAVSAVTAAVLCVTMAFGTTASAATDPAWKEAKTLANAKYNSNYIKLAEKYSKKESSKTVTFEKSKTKKFLDKQIKAIKSDDPKFSVYAINKDEIAAVAYKDDKIKIVLYSKDIMNIGMYTSSKNMVMVSPADKEKITMPVTEDADYEETMDGMLDGFMNFNDEKYYENLGIKDTAKGKYFKIKSDDKTYYYEEFKSSQYDKFGFLFNEKGKPIAMVGDEMVACFSLSYSVKDSEFKVPKDYKEVDLNDLQ